MNQPSINAIGTAVPINKISQDVHYQILESANGMSRKEQLTLRKIYSNSGIATRYSVLAEFGESDNDENILFHPANHHAPLSVSQRMKLYEQYATRLGAEAGENCLKQLPELNRSDITHLITYSCTGMFAPGIDIQLTEKLNLNRNVERTCINFMGCYAAINALKVADHIVRSQTEAVVIIIGVELCTLHYQKNEFQDQVVANALFSDGAAACVVSSKTFSNENTLFKLSLQNFYSEFEPTGKDEMVWRIGDFGFDLRLSAYVPQLIKDSINQLIEKLLVRAKIEQHEIDFYAIHPGGVKILEACEQALNISKAQNQISYNILRDYGNMSSVTILFVLSEYLKSFSDTDKGKKILTCAFGPGLTMESMIVAIS